MSDYYADAMAYYKQKAREMSGLTNMATATTIGQQSILTNTTGPLQFASHQSAGRVYPLGTQNVVQASVERVDNGYILRMGYEGHIAKVKICKDMDELKDMFVATMVEYQLEK